MRSQTESRIYIAAFIVIAIITLSMCCYFNGRTDEAMREDREQYQAIDAAVQARDFWKDKYNSLSHEADPVVVLAAEVRFERGEQ